MFITFNQVSMAYGNKLLFTDVNLKLTSNNRYALVGANGAGKSTFMRNITGEEAPLDGVISIAQESVIGWLKQDQYRYEETNIIDVVIQGKPELWKAMTEKDELLTAPVWDDQSGLRLAVLEEIIARLDGYSAVPFAEKLLIGLGIEEKYHYQPLKALSGGFKLRVLLAQTLFQQPDILLLDEPTNHLDIVSIQWLEKYLKNEYQGLLIFISHDMDFINHLADAILDIDYGEILQYSGQYEKFLAEKALAVEQKMQAKKQIDKRIEEMTRFVERFKATASKAAQAQSRVKMIEKEKLQLPNIKSSSRVAPGFRFQPLRQSGKHVLKVEDLSKSFQDRTLFQNVSFEINRGEKIAIVGVNGAGKSTLLKILLGIVKPDNGHFEWGHETHLSYFSQDHHEELNTSENIFEWLRKQVKDRTDQDIRKTLGQVLFRQDEVFKNILNISGGEAARLLLARVMLDQGNVLILDEPTNHLDIEATEALANALVQYSGTVVLVSHNRHFISKIANRVLSVSHRGLRDFRSFADYETFMFT